MTERKVIRNILESLEEKVISKKQLVSAICNVIQDESIERLIANLRRNGEIRYIFKGFYYIVSPEEYQGGYTKYSPEEMVYATLNRLNIRWYLGLESALERNRITWQGVVSPIIINSLIRGDKKIQGVTFRFLKMNRAKFDFGFVKRTTKNRITFYYSDPEKTLLDYVSFHRRIPIELSSFQHEKKTRSYLSRYSRNFRKKVLGS